MKLSPADNGSRYGIGIDTGGTCTDGVIADLTTGEVVAKAKALTTPEDLSIGIGHALRNLDPGLLRASGFVALSTTLATNSIVEGRGARVGLIMAVPRTQSFSLAADLPYDQVAVISGAHNHRGEMTVALAHEAPEKIDSLAPLVDAFAISSYFSIYNNEHELALRSMVTSRTGKPAVCTHELSGAVGMVERAVTAVLNARLLPVIDELVSAVERILTELGLDIPLMIVRGDGSMMTAATCRTRPVETVLSGPAASVAGACRLSGIENGLVVDIGGTTTDIAVMQDGSARVLREGAMVGGWRTRVQAVDMWTLGAGGDSRIRCSREGTVLIGPQRVIPFSLAGTFFPEMTTRLDSALAHLPRNGDTEHLTFFTLRKGPPGQLSPMVQRLVEALDKKVCSLAEIKTGISHHLDLERFVALGYIIEVGFTPTDLLHTTGESELWDSGAAHAGLRLLAARHGRNIATSRMQELIRHEMNLLLATPLAAKALQQDNSMEKVWDEQCRQLLDRLLRLDNPAITADFSLRMPLIAVGAPAKAHLPPAAKMLRAIPVIPPHAEVANAYGAVTGKVVASASSVIKPASPDGYIILCREQREKFIQLPEAIRRATEICAEEAKRQAMARGAEDIIVTEQQEELFAPLEEGWGDPVLIEMRITATASGSPLRLAHPQPAPWPSAAILPAGMARPGSLRG